MPRQARMPTTSYNLAFKISLLFSFRDNSVFDPPIVFTIHLV